VKNATRALCVALGSAAATLSGIARADDAASLDEIVVTAIRDAAARAAKQQRESKGVTTVVSADTIGRFPDPNIAEALQRAPGVAIQRDQGEGRYVNVRGGPAEFSAVSIDGVSLPAPDPTTRAIDLDTIPSDVVRQLEIVKTLRPDQDADSITGAIDIKTQSAFDHDGFQLRATAGGSYNDFGGTSDVRGSLSVSNLLGADRTIGVLMTASYSETERQVDNIETAWTRLARPDGGQVFAPIENLFKDYDTNRERLAFTGAADWRPGSGNRLYLRGTWSRYTDDEFRNRLSILWTEGTLQPGSTNAAATFANTRIEKQVRHRIQRNVISTVEGGGEHELGDWTLDWSASLASSEQTYPRRDELLFRSSLRPRLSYDYGSNSLEPAISLFNTNEHLNIGAYAFRENAYRSNTTEEDVTALSANLARPVAIGGSAGTFKAGLKYSSGERTADEERFRNRAAGAAPTTPLAQLLSSEPSRNYGYLLGSKFAEGSVDAYFDATKGASPRRVEQSTVADYAVDETVLAGYAMWDLDFGRLNVLAGLRAERTETDGTANVFNVATNAIAVRRDERTYTDVFPGITLRYEFSDQLIGRAALTRGMVRPNFEDIVPRAVESQEGTQLVVTQGNPDLEPTLSNNLDLSLEYYFEPIGIVSAGLFYKDLSDYAYTLRGTGSYLNQSAVLVRPDNAPEGSLTGAELAWQQQFTQLPGLLSGFGVFANFTWVDAEIDLGRSYAGRSKFPLPGQSETTLNLALFYEKGPFSARLSYTDRGDYLNEINAEDGALDLYWEGRDQLDLTASWQFSKAFEAFVEAKNLTNTAGVRYYGDRSRVYEYEKFGYTVFVGGRLKL
jgi:TonB-dependent receptor